MSWYKERPLLVVISGPSGVGKDAVKVLFEGYTKDAIGVYNVGTGKEVTINDLANEVISTVGNDVNVIYKEARKGEVYRSLADVSKLREDLGMDSLCSLELLSTVSEEFKLDLEMEAAMGITTLQDAFDFIERNWSEQKSDESASN